jgi:hypothetical protein
MLVNGQATRLCSARAEEQEMSTVSVGKMVGQLWERCLNLIDSFCGTGNFDDQLSVTLIVEVDDDRIFGFMDVPKNPIAMVIEGPGSDYSWDMSTGYTSS